jgi:hypothetical protein
MDVKIGYICSCTQKLISGGEVRVTLINLGPLRCLVPTGIEHYGECSNGRATEAVSDTIFAHCFILDVEMELF